MTWQRIVLGLVFSGFLFMTGLALAQHGYQGFFDEAGQSAATRLLFADLVICLVLITVWMIGDARRRGRRVWPFVALSAVFGAAGPLLCLLTGRSSTAS